MKEYQTIEDVINKKFDVLNDKTKYIMTEIENKPLNIKLSHVSNMINNVLLNYDKFSKYGSTSYENKQLFAQQLLNLLKSSKEIIEENIKINKYPSFDKETLNNLINDLSGLTDSKENIVDRYNLKTGKLASKKEYEDTLQYRKYPSFVIKDNYKNLNKTLAIDIIISKFHSNRHLLIDITTSIIEITDREKSTELYKHWKLKTENQIIDTLNNITKRDINIFTRSYHVIINRYSLEDDYEENWL